MQSLTLLNLSILKWYTSDLLYTTCYIIVLCFCFLLCVSYHFINWCSCFFFFLYTYCWLFMILFSIANLFFFLNQTNGRCIFQPRSCFTYINDFIFIFIFIFANNRTSIDNDQVCQMPSRYQGSRRRNSSQPTLVGEWLSLSSWAPSSVWGMENVCNCNAKPSLKLI